MNKMPIVLLLLVVITVTTISCASFGNNYEWIFYNTSSYTVKVYNSAPFSKYRDWKDFSLKPGAKKTVWSSHWVEWNYYPECKVEYVEKTKSQGYGYTSGEKGAVVFDDKDEPCKE